jgi:anti-sigma B factor antagonist
MKLSARRHGADAVVAASGELDLDVADQLRTCLTEVLGDNPERVVIDLTAATFVDSVILGVFVGTRNRLGHNHDRLWFVCQNPAVLKTFRMTGLDEVFTIRPTLADALSAP